MPQITSMDDWQEQVQEVQALKAIYAEDFCIPGLEALEEQNDGSINESYSRLANQTPPSGGLEAELLVQLAPANGSLDLKVRRHLFPAKNNPRNELQLLLNSTSWLLLCHRNPQRLNS